ADGIQANAPFAFNIRLDRARLHRVNGHKLDHPASPKEIVGWLEATLAKSPRSLIGQAELALALEFAGRKAEAQRIENALRANRPDTAFVRTLIGEAR